MPAINFKVQGKGAAIVLIHGFCETLEMWNNIVSELAKDYRVFSIDLPGFGGSPLPKEQVSIELIAKSVADWAKEQGIDRAVFIGHSLGGYVALALAELYPDLINGIGLAHSNAYADPEEGKINRDKVVKFIERHGHEKWIETFAPSLFAKENVDHCQAAIKMVTEMGVNTQAETIIAYTLAMKDRKDRFEVWENIEDHCLFIGGTEDSRISPEISEEHIYAREKVDGHILPGIGHMGMFEDQPNFIEIVSTYLHKASH